MGAVSSRPPDELLASLSTEEPSSRKSNPVAYPNYFEAKSVATDLAKFSSISTKRDSFASQNTATNTAVRGRRDKRKLSSISQDSSSTLSSNSATLNSPSPILLTPPELLASACNNIKLEYETLDGRRYLTSPGHHYYLPCDDEEADRLVVLHFLIKYAFSGNMIAPVIQSLRAKPADNEKYSTQVLDIGCGPGSWILEMATEFPYTEFHGIDLRTMFPTTIKPSNTKFIQYDFLKGLPYKNDTFDFIRMRLMLAFITEEELLYLLAEIHRVLKPLGHFEILDCEYQIQRPGVVCENIFNHQLREIIHLQQGITAMPCHHVATLLMTRPLETGFTNVHQQRISIPMGWGGQLGEVHLQNFCAYIRSIHPDVKNSLMLDESKADIDQVLLETVKECKERQSHVDWFVCYGQKPSYNLAVSNQLAISLPSENKLPRRFSLMTPISSPSLSPTDMANNECFNNDESSAWDSICDFAEGYTDD